MYDLAETRHPHHVAPGLDARAPISLVGPSRVSIYRNGGKRALDLLLVVFGGLLILPLMIVIALLVKRDGGAVFYSQKRIGQNGEEFTFWKFRSMVPDAEQRLADHLAEDPAAEQEWKVTQKLRNDPRITPIGRFIRKTSLDELPQLWNVICGDMSLVGPRPMMPSQKDLYPGTEYYALRPGLTGYWQVSKRNNVSFAARAKYDAMYYRELSLAADIKTLFKTVGAVVRGSGC
jgi:lipopolysaccharide/colanic/teichoic acid biosynthesis glycosyltransferase